MKISEYIEELEKLKTSYGDIEVVSETSLGSFVIARKPESLSTLKDRKVLFTRGLPVNQFICI